MTQTPTPSQPMVCDEDREFFERELASFLPDRIFDAHVHLWHPQFFRRPFPQTPEVFGYDQLDEMLGFVHRDRLRGALFISAIHIPNTPRKELTLSIDWIARQTAAGPNCRGLFFILGFPI